MTSVRATDDEMKDKFEDKFKNEMKDKFEDKSAALTCHLSLVTCHLSLFFDPHLVERAFAVAPVFLHFDEEFEVRAVAEKVFDVAARLYADLLDAFSGAPDDDGLLRRALDIDDAVDAREIFALLVEALGDDRCDVWDFVARRAQNLLAHDLGAERAHGLIGQFVFGEERLLLGQVLDDFGEPLVNHVARARRERHDLAPVVLPRPHLSEP